jgi:hypothetical protein
MCVYLNAQASVPPIIFWTTWKCALNLSHQLRGSINFGNSESPIINTSIATIKEPDLIRSVVINLIRMQLLVICFMFVKGKIIWRLRENAFPFLFQSDTLSSSANIKWNVIYFKNMKNFLLCWKFKKGQPWSYAHQCLWSSNYVYICIYKER